MILNAVTGSSSETEENPRETYGADTRIVIEALKTPGRTFSIRVNTLRISREEVLRRLEEELDPEAHPGLEKVVLIPVFGSFDLLCRTAA